MYLSFFSLTFSYHVSFIFYYSKIHTNQQIKEDIKSYKTSEKTFLPVLVMIHVAVVVCSLHCIIN